MIGPASRRGDEHSGRFAGETRAIGVGAESLFAREMLTLTPFATHCWRWVGTRAAGYRATAAARCCRPSGRIQPAQPAAQRWQQSLTQRSNHAGTGTGKVVAAGFGARAQTSAARQPLAAADGHHAPGSSRAFQRRQHGLRNIVGVDGLAQAAAGRKRKHPCAHARAARSASGSGPVPRHKSASAAARSTRNRGARMRWPARPRPHTTGARSRARPRAGNRAWFRRSSSWWRPRAARHRRAARQPVGERLQGTETDHRRQHRQRGTASGREPRNHAPRPRRARHGDSTPAPTRRTPADAATGNGQSGCWHQTPAPSCRTQNWPGAR